MSQNALGRETSPYLLQHADNPVDWYPWCDEALARAREENRPILLSIGYSACHWCHVMAHESFEDEETAALMNKYFINIKVDREERPDLDHIYQTAQHLLTRRTGGWPLTMFLTPDDHVPFFGGTYFPRESRYGLPGFRELLTRVHEAYRENEAAIRDQNLSLQQALENMEPDSSPDGVSLGPEPLRTAISQFKNTFNARSGGFGGAPKFPHPTNLEFLLTCPAPGYEALADRDEARNMALFTLEKMARGGIYDHAGGGFARYSVDDEWMIPHFEKMLYDNGPLLGLTTQAWQISGDRLFRDSALETAHWVIREMQSPAGGYYSSLDADSEGEEGKYYVWDRDEIQSLLDEREFGIVRFHFGLDNPPNFEGRWHLYEQHTLTETAQQFNMGEDACNAVLKTATGKLFHAREQRVRPGRDDKILTSWNALMIRGMATAARVFDDDSLLASSTAALRFIRDSLWVDGRLLATCKDGRAHLNAYLDDYALLIEAILEQLQVRWDTELLNFAIELAEVLLERFADDPCQGFYFTSHDHEHLLVRNKPWIDETLPAGNGVAARALNLLGHLTAGMRYLNAAEQTLKSAWQSLERIPYAHGSILCALMEHLIPPEMIILRGPREEIDAWRRSLNALGHHPGRCIYAIADHEQNLPGILAVNTKSNVTRAQICRGNQCLAPVYELQTLLDNLKTDQTR